MKTSHLQYITMVEFMEANGDLSKPSGGPRGRHYIQMKWKELTIKLNSDGSGDPRSEEKWRKVWSDYKNNVKKKCAKIHRAATGTGGGPTLKLVLTDLENRVIQIIGLQAATGMMVEEAGFHMDTVVASVEPEASNVEVPSAVFNLEWNTPGTSSQPTVAPVQPPDTAASSPTMEIHPPLTSPEGEWKPPPQKKRSWTW